MAKGKGKSVVQAGEVEEEGGNKEDGGINMVLEAILTGNVAMEQEHETRIRKLEGKMERMDEKLDFLVEKLSQMPLWESGGRREPTFRTGEPPPSRGHDCREGGQFQDRVYLSGQGFYGKSIRFEVPTYDGENGEVGDWIYQVEQVFRYHETPRNQWVSIAAMHLRGEALRWQRWYEGLQEGWPTWGLFTGAMLKRFGPSEYEDFAESLMRLQQTGSLKEYNRQFESLSSKVPGLTEEFLISCYFGGLKDELRFDVKMLGPKTLTAAMGLAKLLDEKLSLQKRGIIWFSERTAIGEKGGSSLPPITHGDAMYTSAAKFEDLNLSKELIRGLYVEMGFDRPSKIQAKTLPMILNPPYKDLVAQAHNGSGKTTCFVLGMLSRVDPSKKIPQAICICPTRELAQQNQAVLMKMGKFTGITSMCAIPSDSHVPVSRQSPITEQVVIGTPGTIKKWMTAKKLATREVKILVFDEADHMLAEAFLYNARNEGDF